MTGKYALIIANTEYADSGLARLTAPGRDAEDFARVLRGENLCAFDDVSTLLNKPSSEISEAIDGFFDQKKPDDLLVLYFSGHGVRDELGALYLAVKNTNRFRLRSTAIKSDFIKEAMDQCRSRRQVLILDCCNSGAFAQGTKAATGMSVGTATAFEGGFGRMILTASDSTQYAWEGDRVIGNTENSLFTHFLIKGLEGNADLNKDGNITVDELYDYAYEQVRLATPKQSPSKFATKQQGEIILREYTEEQKEELRLEKINAAVEQERAEKERLEALLKEQEAAEQRRKEILAAKQAAEFEATQAQKELEIQNAKIEAARREIALLQEQQSSPIRSKKTLYSQLAIVTLVLISILSASFYAISIYQNSTTSSMQTLPPEADDIVEKVEAIDLSLPAKPLFPEGESLPTLTIPISADNADSVSQITRWGKGIINNFTFSSDGKKIAVATSIGIYLLEGEDLSETRLIETGNKSIIRIAFSNGDNTLIAITSRGDLLKITTSDGSFIEGYKGELEYVSAADISPDNKTVAISGSTSGGFIILYQQDITSGEIVKKTTTNLPSYIYSIKYSPDGKLLLTSGANGIYLFNATTGSLIRKISTEKNYSTQLAFTPDSNYFAYNDFNTGKTKIVDPNTGDSIREFDDYSDGGLFISEDGKTLYYSVDEGVIRTRNFKDGALQKNVKIATSFITSFQVSPDQDKLIALYNDSFLILWDLVNNKAINSYTNYSYWDNEIALSGDNRYLLSVSNPTTLRDLQTGEIIQEINPGNYGSSSGAVFSSVNNVFIFEPTNSSAIEIWKITSGFINLNRQININTDNILAVSPNGNILATNNYHDVILWDISGDSQNPIKLFTLLGYTGYISSVKFSPDGSKVAIASQDKTAHLWSTETGTKVGSIEGYVGDGVNDTSFSPDGKYLIISSGDGLITLIDLETSSVISSTEILPGEVPDKLEFFSDDNLLLVSTQSGKILIWDIETNSLVNTLTAHSELITKIIVSSDAKYFISSSDDGTIRLWGLAP